MAPSQTTKDENGPASRSCRITFDFCTWSRRACIAALTGNYPNASAAVGTPSIATVPNVQKSYGFIGSAKGQGAFTSTMQRLANSPQLPVEEVERC